MPECRKPRGRFAGPFCRSLQPRKICSHAQHDRRAGRKADLRRRGLATAASRDSGRSTDLAILRKISAPNDIAALDWRSGSPRASLIAHPAPWSGCDHPAGISGCAESVPLPGSATAKTDTSVQPQAQVHDAPLKNLSGTKSGRGAAPFGAETLSQSVSFRTSPRVKTQRIMG